jgi:hypothetical protein
MLKEWGRLSVNLQTTEVFAHQTITVLEDDGSFLLQRHTHTEKRAKGFAGHNK